MSSEAVHLLRTSYEAFNRGDWSTAFAHLDETFELHDHSLPDVPVYRGRDAIRSNIAQMGDAFGDLRFEPREIIELRDRVLVLVHASGRGRESGVEVGGAVGHLWTLRDGSALRLDAYPSWDEALERGGNAERNGSAPPQIERPTEEG